MVVHVYLMSTLDTKVHSDVIFCEELEYTEL